MARIFNIGFETGQVSEDGVMTPLKSRGEQLKDELKAQRRGLIEKLLKEQARSRRHRDVIDRVVESR
jgi:hypothetical protein